MVIQIASPACQGKRASCGWRSTELYLLHDDVYLIITKFKSDTLKWV